MAEVKTAADNFGVRPLIRSEERRNRTFTRVGDINASADGKEVLVRARIYTSRGTGTVIQI